MKTAFSILLALALIIGAGCKSTSPRGGGSTKEAGFKVMVPYMTTDIKQGETRNVMITLNRGGFFKQDVKLDISVPKGLSVEPTSETIKASQRPDMQLRIAADKDAALGQYPVKINAAPEEGSPTSTQFTVRIVAP
jgi:uncharacterized membrane protein